MTPFWYGWPKWTSWIVEFVSGLLVIGFVSLISVWLEHVPAVWALLTGRFILAQAISWYYERYKDPNKWSWSDVGQRSIGITAGLFLWHAIVC